MKESRPSGWEIHVRRRDGVQWETLTRENTTKDGYRWPSDGSEYVGSWDDMDWAAAEFYRGSIWTALGCGPDPHIRVPCPRWETAHRIRGRRVKILDARRVE
jgi:hypothetical protein